MYDILKIEELEQKYELVEDKKITVEEEIKELEKKLLEDIKKGVKKGIYLEHLENLKEKYKVPEGTQSGTKFTIRNKGFKAINSSSSGDFIFTVTVQIPKKLTKEQRDLLTALAKTMNEQPPVKKRGLFG